MASCLRAVCQEEQNLSKLIRARYGGGLLPPDVSENETIATLLSHRSVRAYSSTAVPQAHLELAIAAAQSAPTSNNFQAWSVVAIRDKERIRRVNEFAGKQRHIANAPLFLVWLADLSRIERISKHTGSPKVSLDYLESFIVGVVDTSLAAQNAVATFESLGLGICCIGGVRNHPEEIAQILKLPKLVFPVMGMTVGYPDESNDSTIKPRLPQDVILHSEEYSAERPEDLRRYDDLFRSYQINHRSSVTGWTEVMAERVSKIENLTNRDKLRGALNNLGFELK